MTCLLLVMGKDCKNDDASGSNESPGEKGDFANSLYSRWFGIHVVIGLGVRGWDLCIVEERASLGRL